MKERLEIIQERYDNLNLELLKPEVYNDYTYRLVASSQYEDYKDSVLKLLHPSGTAVYPIMKTTDNKNITVGYSNVTFIETDAIAEVSYSDDGKLIVTIYGPASLDIETTRINFYRNGKIVYVAQICLFYNIIIIIKTTRIKANIAKFL